MGRRLTAEIRDVGTIGDPSEPRRTISLLPHDEQEGSLPTIDQQYAEAEPTLERAAEDVTEAKGEIRTLLHSDPGRTWTIRDIQEKLSHWRGTIIHLAVLDMARHNELILGDDLTVEVVTLRAS